MGGTDSKGSRQSIHERKEALPSEWWESFQDNCVLSWALKQGQNIGEQRGEKRALPTRNSTAYVFICVIVWLVALEQRIFKKWWVVLVAQQCQTLCNPKDCSLPVSSVHGNLQAKILEWVATSSSRRSSQHRDWTQVSCLAGRFFTIWGYQGSPTTPRPAGI